MQTKEKEVVPGVPYWVNDWQCLSERSSPFVSGVIHNKKRHKTKLAEVRNNAAPVGPQLTLSEAPILGHASTTIDLGC